MDIDVLEAIKSALSKQFSLLISQFVNIHKAYEIN